ncbi:MAG TPA: MauE/DoxX family redox-associated membrane protein [Puia sp.]|nr:MauE/DoxX family redox-associated membrane protein [Puia sp.]
MSKRQVLLKPISALLILLFLYASISKSLDFKTFVGVKINQAFPNSWIPFLIWAMNCSEIAINLSLIFERICLVGFYALLILTIIFTLYAGSAFLHFFVYVPAPGVIRNLNWRQHLLFNLFFVTLAIISILLKSGNSFKTIITTNDPPKHFL